MKILAIDPGTATGGWAFVEDGVLVDSGHWAGHGLTFRLPDDVLRMVIFLKPDIVVIERYVAYNGAKKESQAVAEVVGAILFGVQSIRGATKAVCVPYATWAGWWRQFELKQLLDSEMNDFLHIDNEHERDAAQMALGYYFVSAHKRSKKEDDNV